MDLANELILEVGRHLPKPDLKACRLVSKSWSPHASEYLFSKIYISPRKEDIEVFNLITQHPQLSHCVRHLEYDGTSFSPSYSKHDYVRRLFEQATAYSELYRTALNNTDLHFTQFVELGSKTSATLIAAGQESSRHTFVLEGYRAWKDRDEYQQKVVKNGEFFQTLKRGLSKLDLLTSVEVCNEWNTWRLADSCMSRSPADNVDLSGPYFYGSPFGRAWGLSHPNPRGWVQKTSPEENFATGHEEFQIITIALSQSQRRIRWFHISTSPVSIFGSEVTKILVNHSINAYSSLESLTLCFNGFDVSREMSVEHKSLPGLQALLGSMSGLRRLMLSLPSEWYGNKFLNYRQVFPTDGTQWTRLTKLDISTLAISVKDLVHLLTSKMSSLRELTFSNIELLEGRWEGVIEFLKVYMRLLSFTLDEGCQLLHLGRRDFLDDMEAHEDNSLYENIETYVVSGGRHPCLRWDEDASASRKYILDLGV